jgi:outer membrane protein OmpA-like peptidoglycan-associated protein
MKFRYALIFLMGMAPFITSGQEITNPLPRGHYIVVAAFTSAQSDYAQRYANSINKDGNHAKFGFDEGRKFYYVYLDYYSDFDQSIDEMLKVRKAGGFPQAWVRVMKNGASPETSPVAKQPEPKKEKMVMDAKPVEQSKPIAQVQEPKPVPQPVVPVTKTPEPESTVSSGQVTIEVIENPTPKPVYRPQVLKSTPVFLSLFNPTNNNPVDGQIEVVDTDRAKLLTKVKGNDYVTLPDPKSNSGNLTLISDSFGFRKVQHQINYKSTEADTLQPYVALMGNYYMIKFDMIKLQPGDISTLYNVYFYNDAAVMLPESKYELNKLLQLMQQNPDYKIMLHGHTNGRAGGKVITMGPSKNYFELVPDVKKGIGTAKDLSRDRAEVIRDWLIDNGISADRMEVKAWGGTRMIHDQNSAQARKNVRVEVEVLK